MLAIDAVFAGGLADGELSGNDLQDRDFMLGRHGSPLSPMSRLICRVSVVAYVVNSHTLVSTVFASPDTSAHVLPARLVALRRNASTPLDHHVNTSSSPTPDDSATVVPWSQASVRKRDLSSDGRRPIRPLFIRANMSAI